MTKTGALDGWTRKRVLVELTPRWFYDKAMERGNFLHAAALAMENDLGGELLIDALTRAYLTYRELPIAADILTWINGTFAVLVDRVDGYDKELMGFLYDPPPSN